VADEEETEANGKRRRRHEAGDGAVILRVLDRHRRDEVERGAGGDGEERAADHVWEHAVVTRVDDVGDKERNGRAR